MMRVLMTADTLGGVWTFAIELSRALAQQGVETILATLGRAPNQSQLAEVAAIPNLRFFPSNYKLEWMDDPWRDVHESGRWLLDLEERFAPEIVHLNSLAHGDLPWRAPVVLTVHSCVASWWRAVKGTALPEEWSRYRGRVQRSLEAATTITAPSQAMLDSLSDSYGVRLADARVVYNGRSAARFSSAAKWPYILSAGRLWDQGKNMSALAAITERLPWLIYLAGDPTAPSGTCFQAAGCRLLGHLSAHEMTGFYAHASIYALPARYEPFGLSVLEAALSGCALVLGDIPSLREIWREAAIFVPPDNEQALEAALLELIADRSKREAMARQALERAREFTPESMARGYIGAYARARTESYACAS